MAYTTSTKTETNEASALMSPQEIKGVGLRWYPRVTSIADLGGPLLLKAWWDCFKCHWNIWQKGVRDFNISNDGMVYYLVEETWTWTGSESESESESALRRDRNASVLGRRGLLGVVGALMDYDLGSTTPPYPPIHPSRGSYKGDVQLLVWLPRWTALKSSHAPHRLFRGLRHTLGLWGLEEEREKRKRKRMGKEESLNMGKINRVEVRGAQIGESDATYGPGSEYTCGYGYGYAHDDPVRIAEVRQVFEVLAQCAANHHESLKEGPGYTDTDNRLFEVISGKCGAYLNLKAFPPSLVVMDRGIVEDIEESEKCGPTVGGVGACASVGEVVDRVLVV